MRWLAFLPPGWSDTQPWVFEQLCTRPPPSKCAEKAVGSKCGKQQCRKKAWLCQATLRNFHVEKGWVQYRCVWWVPVWGADPSSFLRGRSAGPQEAVAGWTQGAGISAGLRRGV